MSERQRAIRYLSELVVRHRAHAASGRCAHPVALFWRARAAMLSREIGLMQAAGEPGETLARRWCRLVGV